VEDTYNLLAEGLRQVLRVLANIEKSSVESFAEAHDFRRYMAASFKGTVTINWDNESERQTVLTSLVADCDRVLSLVREALSAHADDPAAVKELEESADLLSKILAQDVRRTASGEAEIITGVAPDRIVSVHDPEMRHGRKSASQRFDGYKGAIAVDTDSQIITAVDVLPGNAHDATNKEELLTETEQATAATVTTVLGDTAYGTIEQRVAASTSERHLIAPVPRTPQTGRFTKEEFTIDLGVGSVTCPAGQTTTTWAARKDCTKSGKIFHNKAFRFAAHQCGQCPLRDQCVKPGAAVAFGHGA
jgi:Transposase DDE domain